MGSEYTPNRRRYDITMSKRTRRSFYLEDDSSEGIGNNLQEGTSFETDSFLVMTDSPEEVLEEEVQIVSSPEKEVPEELEEKGNSKSFEQLIRGEKDNGELKTGRSSLGQHFTEEEKQKQLQVVVRKQKQEGAEGLKLKGLMRRYAKVLGHLIKNKNEPRKGSRKKPVLQLTM